MRVILLSIYVLFFLSFFTFADELIVGNKKFGTYYTQKAEFLAAKGDSVVGPIDLLPFADTNSLVILNKNQGLKILTYLIEPVFSDWKKNLIGKTISYEGSGRIIKGVVRDISNDFITIDTKRGIIITTLPKFPSKISCQFSWKEIYSPKITLRISSETSDSVVLYIKYKVKNIFWEPYYIIKKYGKKGKFYSFYNIKNNTQIYFNNIDIYLHKNRNNILLTKKTSLPPLSEKRVKMYKTKNIEVSNGAYIGKEFPNGRVIIYENNKGILIGKIVNGRLKL